MDFGKKKRFGNFEALKYKKGDFPYIKVSDIAGAWSVEFAMAHMMYAYIDSLNTAEDWKVLNILAVSWLGATSILNSDFTKDVCACIDKYVDSVKDASPSTEEELEEQEILAEMERALEKEAENGVQSATEEGA